MTNIIIADFENGLDGFVYQDDVFGTNQPGYASGTLLARRGFDGTKGLQLVLGGLDREDITGISGGFTQSFTLAEASLVTITFHYKMDFRRPYEGNEYGDVLASLDGVQLGSGPDGSIARLDGDGPTSTGWQTFTITLDLAAGDHELVLGGFNNMKTDRNEFTKIFFDNVAVTGEAGANSPIGPLADSDGTANAIAEDAAAGTLVGVTALAIDSDDGDSVTYAFANGQLVSADGTFQIDSGTGVISLAAGAALDFETQPSLSASVVASSSDGTSSQADFGISVTDANDAPTVSLANAVATFTTDLDTRARIKVADIVVSDVDSGVNTLSLTGFWSDLFEIDETEIYLKAGADIDLPINTLIGANVNVDDATVGTSPDDSALLEIRITNVNQPPSFAADILLAEISEDTDTSSRVKIADIAIVDDGQGTNVLWLTGQDSVDFELDGTELFLRDGTVLDINANQTLVLFVNLDDPSVNAPVDASLGVLVDVVNANQGTIIDLATLAPEAGFRLEGIDFDDRAGNSLSTAGDFNGDGLGDVIIGAPFADGANNADVDAGESYVVFGQTVGQGDLQLASLSASDGFTIFDATHNDRSGYSVASVGDINGDGFDDLIIGAFDGNNGAAHVLFGRDGPVTDVNLGALTPVEGFSISGPEAMYFRQWSVSSAGDVNGDGIDDFAIGAADAEAMDGLRPNAGESYILFGRTDGFSDIDLDVIAPSEGFTVFGSAVDDYSGLSVASAGDINGDGFDDVIIGAPTSRFYGNLSDRPGQSYVIFGKSGGFSDIDLVNLAPSDGFTIHGIDPDDRSGHPVASAGDVNGDGFDDILIGAWRASGAGNLREYSGESYLIFGKPGGFSDIDLASLVPAEGITINGANSGNISGLSLSSAGDFNGDGLDDVLISAVNLNAHHGAAYVIYGKSEGFADIDLDSLSPEDGLTILGSVDDDWTGYSVSSAGDLNGDGFDDVIVSAGDSFYASGTPTFAGHAYVIYGSDVSGAVTQQGTSAGESLAGTAADDVIVAGRGDDTVSGAAGADLLKGGAGNDTLDGGAGDDRLEGDSGDDLFVFAAGGGADLILDFEQGDLSDPVNDSIALQGLAGVASFGDLDTNGDLRLDSGDAAVTFTDGALVIDFGGGDSLALIGTLYLDALAIQIA
ncbi:MAG: hypothetical protein AAF495_18575 [Pseudomonadota bacterium]